MLIQQDNFLISVTDTVERPLLFGENGQPLIIDTDYNAKDHRKQIGTIEGLPIRVTDQYIYDKPLKKGDKVLMNHLALENRQHYLNNWYRVEYYLIFAKINEGVLEPLEDFIFCDSVPIKQDSAIQLVDKKSEKYAKIIALSNKAKSLGLQIDDIVYFTHNANYSFNVGEVEFTRLRVRNVIGIERDGKLIPMRNKVLVEQIEEFDYICGIRVLKPSTNQKTGIVLQSSEMVKGINKGDKVSFYLGSASSLTWKGKNYAFVTDDNIKFIYEN